jgi:hypothetical protein
MVPSSRGLGHRPFTAGTGIRIPLGLPYKNTLSLGVALRVVSDKNSPQGIIGSVFLYGKEFGVVGKLVTPVDCKSAALVHCWFDPNRLHQVIRSDSISVSIPHCHCGETGSIPVRTANTPDAGQVKAQQSYPKDHLA